MLVECKCSAGKLDMVMGEGGVPYLDVQEHTEGQAEVVQACQDLSEQIVHSSSVKKT